ncbi:DUF7486 family protein [Aureitalea marina]|nr:hypothetical protein [Aureitalea marina]
MKAQLQHQVHPLVYLVIILFSSISMAQVLDQDREKLDKPETATPVEIYWNVKAYSPTWGLLRVKAIDKDGNIHDVKAIQDSDDTSLLNVKALVDGQRLPIKLIVKKNDKLYPVKAISQDGTILDIKALTDDGEIIDVKGFSRSGNVIHIRAITAQPIMYRVIAVAPDGTVNRVKGIKMMDQEVETVINGVEVFAHVKALTQN